MESSETGRGTPTRTWLLIILAAIVLVLAVWLVLAAQNPTPTVVVPEGGEPPALSQPQPPTQIQPPVPPPAGTQSP